MAIRSLLARYSWESLTNGLPSRTNVCTRRKRTCGPQGGRQSLTQLRRRQATLGAFLGRDRGVSPSRLSQKANEVALRQCAGKADQRDYVIGVSC